MALIPDQHPQEGGAHRGVIAAGETGIFTFRVSPGRRYNMVIGGNDGTFTVGYYLFSLEDDTNDSLTRIWMPEIVDVTAAVSNAVSTIGMLELGINITVAASTDIQIEVRECKE